MQQQPIHISALTNEQARQWLLLNDPEGAEFYQDEKAECYAHTVADNLHDFGEAHQDGDFFVELSKMEVIGVEQVDA